MLGVELTLSVCTWLFKTIDELCCAEMVDCGFMVCADRFDDNV